MASSYEGDLVTRVAVLESTFLRMERELRERMDMRFENAAEALKLQASEYQRRLGELNNEAGRILKASDKSVPRDTFDIRMEAVEKEVTSLRIFMGKVALAGTVAGAIAGIIAAALTSWMIK